MSAISKYGLLLPFGILLVVTPALSQITAGIRGNIVDESGALVPQAHVTLTNLGTNDAKTTTTDASGMYSFTLLPVGSYSLTVEAQGFKSFKQSDITLTVNQVVGLNVTLQVGPTTQQVEVQGGAPLVNTQTSEVGTLIGARNIAELPLSARNPIQLATLTTGVGFTQIHTAMAGFSEYGSVAGASNSSRLGVNGNHDNQGEYLLDGTEFSGPFYNSGIDYPNPDALQEFRFITSNYSAEFGKTAGGLMNVVTKSGTNQIHGGAWEFNRNSAVGARTFFNPTIPFLNQNQFGFDVGGPVKKNKLFFFGTGQWLRIAEGRSSTGSLPLSDTEKQGALTDPALHPKPILDPNTGMPFPGNIIPSSRLDPIAQKMVNFMLPPNAPGGQWIGTVSEPVNNYQWMSKADYYIRNNHRLTGSFYDDHTFSTSPLDFGRQSVPLNPQFTTGDIPQHSLAVIRDLILTDSISIRPNLINQFRFAYVQFDQDTRNTKRGPTLAQLGSDVPTFADDDIPAIYIAGRVTQNGAEFTISHSHDYQFADSVDYVRGRHDLKLGMEVRDRSYLNSSTASNSGNFHCTGDFSGDAVADFLLGQCNFSISNNLSSESTQKSFAAYIQDNYKVSRRLVLNLGLRYDRYTPWTDKATVSTVSGGHLAPTGTFSFSNFYAGATSKVFTLAPPGLVYPGDAGVPTGLYPTDPKFQPRVGLAWDVFGNGKTSVRAGWGWFTTTTYGWQAYTTSQVPPFYTNSYVPQTPNFTNPITPAAASAFPPKIGPALDFSPYGSLGFQTFPTNFKNGDIQQFNFTIEQALPGKVAVSAGYVGNIATHLDYSTNFNTSIYIPGTDPTTGQPYSTPGNDLSRAKLNMYLVSKGLVAPGQTPFNYVVLEEPSSNSNYHSLQLTMRKELSHGLNWLTAYTWSKAIDYGITAGNAYVSDLGIVQNADCQRCERGLSDMDIRHKFVQSLVYTTPELSQRLLGAKNRAAMYALDSWEVSGIVTLASGLPFNLYTGLDTSLSNNGIDRPDLVGNANLSMSRPLGQKLSEYFNSQAFAPAAIGQFGNFGRDVLIGPGQANVDFAAMKNLPLSERWGKLQLRFEFFNFFNTPHFRSPNGCLCSPNGNKITGVAGPARQIQFGAKYTF